MSKHALAQIKHWIFDLDNTLYPPELDLFAKIDVRITLYIKNKLNLSHEAAFRMQKLYWKKYGTTLWGLMKKHNLNPDDFLDFVHDIDISRLSPDTELDEALAGIGGQKYIFTNGTTQHAENVCRQLGIWHHFDGVFDIRAAEYIPKPQKPAYEKMIAHFNINPAQAVFFEDMARNLPPAAELGLKTVWLRSALSPALSPALDSNAPHSYPSHTSHTSHRHDEPHVFDYTIDALVPFLKALV